MFSLKADDDTDYISDLNKGFVDGTAAFKAHTQLPNTLVLSGDGSKISAKFEPQTVLLIHFDPDTVGEGILSTAGDVASIKKGSGKFYSKYAVLGIVGTYRLQVGATTARLYDKEEEIWFGKGTQEGLDGEYDIRLDVIDGPSLLRK